MAMINPGPGAVSRGRSYERIYRPGRFGTTPPDLFNPHPIPEQLPAQVYGAPQSDVDMQLAGLPGPYGYELGEPSMSRERMMDFLPSEGGMTQDPLMTAGPEPDVGEFQDGRTEVDPAMAAGAKLDVMQDLAPQRQALLGENTDYPMNRMEMLRQLRPDFQTPGGGRGGMYALHDGYQTPPSPGLVE